MFLNSVQGTRSELAGQESVNQESCKANKPSEKEHESTWQIKWIPNASQVREKEAGGMVLFCTCVSLMGKLQRSWIKKKNSSNPTVSQVKAVLSFDTSRPQRSKILGAL